MITININGQEIKLEKAMTILEAARGAGIEIPTLCHYPGLELFGGCRQCLVEVEKMPRLQTSCTVYVTDGMVVRTETEEIVKARKGMLEFLLIHHPLDCPMCDKAGECRLQDLTVQYGPEEGKFREGKRKHPSNFEDPLIVRNTERCILCTRCIRVCEGVQGASALTIRGRGNHSVVEPFSGGRFDCEYCGNCITVCPVGSLMSKLHSHSYRAWLIEEEVKSVCAYCGVGCSMMLQSREGKLARTNPKQGVGINNGILCAKGRFGYDFIESSGRLTEPLIRKNERLVPVTWDEAFTFAAGRLKEIKSRHGGGSIGGVASGRGTNEENYLLQKLMREGLGSNNIDSLSGTGFAVAQQYIEDALGQGATANLISDIKGSDAVITIGGDPAHINPVLGIQVRGAFKRCAKVITIGYAPGLEGFRTHDFPLYPFTEGTLLSAMLPELVKSKGLSGKNAALETGIKEFLAASKPEIKEICGIDENNLQDAIKVLSGVSKISVIIGPDIVQRTDVRTNLFLLSAVAYLLNAKVYLLSERPNEQGLIDVGCVPDKLPGGKPLAASGLTLSGMIEAAHSGSIKAMYIMGDNPVYNLPDSSFVKSALDKLEFLVVQDSLVTETALLADVVLPAFAWAEKDGTYTNLERRIQRLGRAVKGQGMDGWRILSAVGRKLNLHVSYESAEDVMAEIAKSSPLHAGFEYEDIDKGLNLWPYKGEAGSKSLSAGKWQLTEPWTPSKRGSLYLMIDRHMFHSGTISRHSEALNSIYPEPYVKISTETARLSGLADGDIATIRSARGTMHLPVKIEKNVPGSAVLLTNYFREKGGLSLAPFNIEPVTKVLSVNGIEVTLGKTAVHMADKAAEVCKE